MRLSTPYPIVIAAAIVGLQSCVFIVLAVLDLAGLVEGRIGVGIGIGIMLLLVGVGLAAAAVGLLRSAPISRGPVVVAQLIGLGLAWSLRHPDADTGDNRGVGIAIAVSALVVLGCLATKSARRALGDDQAL
ncbi:hypothetical protein [Aeromicrobium duanguangcaii]|uniref:hypothetical protein n=1 Tax=Aeromicrobium duanguangcaii TaxID=2968086 RepID=UPI002018095F|nr:hypothetical protein [Aeromicrobium duanguangcaii]MCL3839063.1 hypothetical protein [Aeromicrobium duanguangcaii]